MSTPRDTHRALAFSASVLELARLGSKHGLLVSEAVMGAIHFACRCAVPDMPRDEFLKMVGQLYDCEQREQWEKAKGD